MLKLENLQTAMKSTGLNLNFCQFSTCKPVLSCRHKIVKVVCRSTRPSPSGCTATYTKSYDNVMVKLMISNRTDAWKSDVNNYSLLMWQNVSSQGVPIQRYSRWRAWEVVYEKCLVTQLQMSVLRKKCRYEEIPSCQQIP